MQKKAKALMIIEYQGFTEQIREETARKVISELSDQFEFWRITKIA